MIADFLVSWELFQATYVAGWSIAFLLALVGVWVVARDQIFLGVAVSQASTLGIALALWLGGSGFGAATAWLASDAMAAGLAVTAAIATALLSARRGGAGSESGDAVTGWVFLVAASVPVLMVAHSPHGLEEVHRLVFSTLLGAGTLDLWIFGALAAVTVGVVARLHPQLLLFALDAEMAAAVGMRTRLWNALIAVWLGLSVGLSIRVSGMLYTFGCLVLPALIAKNLAREIRPLLWLAPAVAVLSAVIGFVLAHHYDTPPAHTTVALLCGELLLAWGVRRLRVQEVAIG